MPTFKHTISLHSLTIEVYAMNFVNNIPTRFQIFVNGYLEGFMYFEKTWKIDKAKFAPGLLSEQLVNEIGEWLVEYYK